MERLICTNKRCKHEFYSSENKKVIKCPVCDAKVYNMDLIINVQNVIYIETIIKNINFYGEEGVFKTIDKLYHRAEQRVRIRKLYTNTIKELKED